MANCVTCKANCISAGQHRVKTDCISYVPKDYPKPITNADRLFRNATDEELASFAIYAGCPPDFGASHTFKCKCGKAKDDGCKGCWLDWLKQEVQE